MKKNKEVKRIKRKSRKVVIGVTIIGFIALAAIVVVLMPFLTNKTKGDISSYEKIEVAHENGEISDDSYVNLLLDLRFNKNILPDEYKGSEGIIGHSEEILRFVNDNFSKLDEKTIKRIIDIYSFSWIRIDDDASKNTAVSPFSNFLSNGNAYAEATSIVTLNKNITSSKGRFVIYYTDTGSSAISDEKAALYAEHLESIVDNYKTIFNLDFKKKTVINPITRAEIQEGMMQSLTEAGEDITALDGTIPVYVANVYSEQSDTYAEYFGRPITKLLKELKEKAEKFNYITLSYGVGLENDEKEKYHNLLNFVPTLSCINIVRTDVNDNDMKLFLAHELAHHYVLERGVELFGEVNGYESFISETIANFMATMVVRDVASDNMINNNHYNDSYLNAKGKKTKKTITEVIGYVTYPFLISYYNNVPNSLDTMLNAAYHTSEKTTKNGKNYAAESLYNYASDDEMKSTWLEFARNNILSEYGNLPVRSYTEPYYEKAPCVSGCVKKYSVNPASLSYLKFEKSKYAGTSIVITSYHNVVSSVIAKTGNKYVLIDNYGIRGGKKMNEFWVDFSSDYDEVILAVANWKMEDEGHYTVKTLSKDGAEILGNMKEYGVNSNEQVSSIEEDGKVITTNNFIGKCTEQDINTLEKGLDDFEEIADFLTWFNGDSDTLALITEFKDSLKSYGTVNNEEFMMMSCEKKIDDETGQIEMEEKVKKLTGSTSGPAKGSFVFNDYSVFTKKDPNNQSWGLYILVYPLVDDAKLFSLEIGLRE